MYYLFFNNYLDTLTSSNEGKRKFFKSALSVFALFEKQINGKDSILIGGNYQKYVSRASLTFGNADSSSGRASRSDFYAYGVTTCYKISCTEQQSARTSIVFDCYYCNTYWSISWGGGSSSNSYWFYDGSGGGNSGGGSSGGSSYSPTVQNLIYLLNLSSYQADWLSYNEQRAIEILYYLQTTPTYLEEAKQISVQHINEMMNNNWYLTFVQMYVQNAQSNLVWWEDDTWLSDPNNFNLDIDAIGNQYGELTVAEKVLVKEYPVQAAIMGQNMSTAFSMSDTKMGTAGGLNDKKDAFRHAFFQAINTMAVGSSITQQFSDAHESEVPSQLLLEKQMDIFNNSVGITAGQNAGFWTSVNDLGNIINNKVDNGELKYLKPLDFSSSPLYDANRDKVQDCPNCRNGIISTTALTWTNQ